MTIEQLVTKLRQASSENWVYIVHDITIDNSITYGLIIDGKHQHTVTQNYIEPIPPNSFTATS